jgi:hypothetical protein
VLEQTSLAKIRLYDLGKVDESYAISKTLMILKRSGKQTEWGSYSLQTATTEDNYGELYENSSVIFNMRDTYLRSDDRWNQNSEGAISNTLNLIMQTKPKWSRANQRVIWTMFS